MVLKTPEEWRWDLAAEVDQTLIERVQNFLRARAKPIHRVRLLAATVLRSWLSVYNRLAIIGRQNIPEGRAFMLIANHASHLDALCLLSALPMRRLHSTFSVAAEDYFWTNRVRRFFAAALVNALPLARHCFCWESLAVCAELLRSPETILIFFPEGTRTSRFEPSTFKAGVGLLAAGSDIPVVPCHLAGTHAALPKGAWWPRPKRIQLTIGVPRVYAHLPPTKESAKQISRELREAIIQLGRQRNGGNAHELQPVGSSVL